MEWRNWSGLEVAHPVRVAHPRDVAGIVADVQRARDEGTTLKMIGTGHSFTGIAVAEHTLVSPQRLSGIVSVDREAMTVTAWAGTPLHVLNAHLERLGLSFHNMGDIAEQTLAGATSTGTHGSGGVVAGLSAQLAGLELVTGTGEVLRASRTENPDVFDLARVGLGALGIITTLTFHVEPLFVIEAHERRATWDEVVSSYDELVAAHHHVDVHWFPHTDGAQLKTNDRSAMPLEEREPLPRWREWFEYSFLENTVIGVVTGTLNRAPAAIPAANRALVRAIGERTYSDLAHRVFVSRRDVRFKEMEYALPAEAGMSALREARRLIDASGWRISFPIEIRSAPADDVPLSTSYGRDTVFLAFHTHVDADHQAFFAGIEPMLRDHEGRPHWGKLHTRTAADLAPVYPRFADFLALRDRLDPDRVFANSYLSRVLG